ncbi:MAG: RhuM family protein [Planctomycetota bacterium]
MHSAATCKDQLQVRREEAREVVHTLRHYFSSVILSVGYRVRSPRGTQFWQWATKRARPCGQTTSRELERTWGTRCVNSSAELGSFDPPWMVLRARQPR